MTRTKRSKPEQAARTAAAAAQPDAASTSRKRSRADALQDEATAPASNSAGPADGGDGDNEDKDRKGESKKRKHDARPQDDAMPAGGEVTAPAAELSSASSSTVVQESDAVVADERASARDQEQDEDMLPTAAPETLDDLSPEERRRRKGKGRADDAVEDTGAKDARTEDSELARIQKELACKNELIASQRAILASLHSAVSCTVCLETLDRPYSLQCGHVFCRKCLVNWFFRPDPDAEDAAAAAARADSAAGSGSESERSRSSSAGSSTGSSYVGGQINGVDFRLRGVPSGATLNETVEALVEAEAQRQRTSGGGGGGVPEDRLGALRAARLARFAGGGGAIEGGSGSGSGTGGGTRIEELPADSFETATRTARAAPAPRAPSPPPPAPQTPPAIPRGDHRRKNLVCPSCRAGCSARAPSRVFVLDEVLASLRRGGIREDGQRTSPGKTPGAGEPDPLVAMDEGDATWGGLFPGPGGTESARDRRRRLAQVVRDREDGVRRCGECNWELDERTGVCEGCGREWEVSSASSGSSSASDASSDGGGGLMHPFNRRHLGRQHHDVAHSDSGSDSDAGGSQDTYDSDDGFLVKSDADEEEGSHAARERRRRSRNPPPTTRRGSSSTAPDSGSGVGSDTGSGSESGSSNSESDDDEASQASSTRVRFRRRASPTSDDDEAAARRARRRARAMRREGEVIDEESDTESSAAESGSSGSDSVSDEANDNPARRQLRAAARALVAVEADEASAEGTSSDGEEEAPTRSGSGRKKRVIPESDSE